VIIRNQTSSGQASCDDEMEIFELSALVFVMRKYGLSLGAVSLAAGFLAFGVLKMFPTALARQQLRTELLFQPTASWALPKTGDPLVDRVVPVFDPLQESEKIISGILPRERLASALEAGGFSLEEAGPVQLASGFLARPLEGGRGVRVQASLLQPRKKAPALLLESPAPLGELQRQGEILVEFLAQELGARYLKTAKATQGEILQALAESEKAHREVVDRIRAIPTEAKEAKQARLFEIANKRSLVLLSVNQLLQSLDTDSLRNPIVRRGPSNTGNLDGGRRIPILCLGLALATFLGGGLYLFFAGPPSRRIFGDQALAAIHPQASIYCFGRDADILDGLLAASLARAGAGHPAKLAAFIPEVESALIERVRKAAEKSGRSFGSEGSMDAEVTLFSSKDLSDEISRLPAKGYGRILLVAKQGEALKARHRCYQAEADLAGVPITDVILMEG
jgi:hypothetical protein